MGSEKLMFCFIIGRTTRANGDATFRSSCQNCQTSSPACHVLLHRKMINFARDERPKPRRFICGVYYRMRHIFLAETKGLSTQGPTQKHRGVSLECVPPLFVLKCYPRSSLLWVRHLCQNHTCYTPLERQNTALLTGCLVFFSDEWAKRNCKITTNSNFTRF